MNNVIEFLPPLNSDEKSAILNWKDANFATYLYCSRTGIKRIRAKRVIEKYISSLNDDMWVKH